MTSGQAPEAPPPPPARDLAILREADRLAASGDARAALALFDAASRGPLAAYALLRTGQVLHAQGAHAAAMDALGQAAALRPGDAPILFALGNAARDLGRVDEAEAHFRAALGAAPASPEPAVNLANLLRRQGRAGEAQAILAASLARNPGSAALLEAAGLAALDARDHEAACASLLEALRLAPGRAETQANLAEAMAGAGRHDEAVRLLDAAIPRLADPALARLNRAHALMALGRWAEAWIDYEARLGRASMAGAARHPARIPLPAWRGGTAPAGPLLVWGEQGLGDEIVGASLLPDLARQVDEIVVEASPRLVALLARSLPGLRVVARDDAAIPPGCVAHVPMGSLMGILGWTPARLPMAPVLVADRARVAAAEARHRRPGRRLVGLAWTSGAGGGLGALKTLPRGELERLVAGSGDVFLDLQYGDTERTRAELAAATGAEILRDREIDVRSDIDGLAALCAACDAVVTTSNVTAHVAGALGAETHVLVPSGHGQLWYWTPSPGAAAFYARATLHRQDGADWRVAVDSVRAALAVRPPTR